MQQNIDVQAHGEEHSDVLYSECEPVQDNFADIGEAVSDYGMGYDDGAEETQEGVDLRDVPIQ